MSQHKKEPGDKEKRQKEKFRKVAKILLALGEENAANVLAHLGQDQIEQILAELLTMNALEAHEAREVLLEFRQILGQQKQMVTGGKDKARQMLELALGSEKAEKYLEKINRPDPSRLFAEIQEYAPEAIGQVLSQELPQTAAVVLSQLSPSYSARVLKLLEPALRAQLARRIAAMQKVSPEALEVIFTSLKKKLEKIDKDSPLEPRGEEKLSAILKYIDSSLEENILTALHDDDPDMARRIREKLFSFADLMNLTSREVRRLVERVPDTDVWARALKGASQELRRHILGSLSVNRSADILSAMEELGSLALSEIENQRRRIMQTAEDLEKNGVIVLRKEKEEYVE